MMGSAEISGQKTGSLQESERKKYQKEKKNEIKKLKNTYEALMFFLVLN